MTLIRIISKFILISLLNPTKIQAQEISKPDIQFVTIQDTFLIKTLDSLIQYEEMNDSLFSKGYGYFNVRFSKYMSYGEILSDNTRVDTVFKYDIQVTFMHPEKEINTLGDMYPSYYSLLGGRVLSFGKSDIGHLLGFSEGSKKVYMEILDKNLAPRSHSSLSYFRLDEVIEIYYLQNRFTGEYIKPHIVRKKLK